MSDFNKIAAGIGELVTEKNSAYGNSFEKAKDILQILYPEGVKPEQFQDMLALVRLIDKMFRIANKKDAFGESPWRDIAGYAILGISNDENTKKANNINDLDEITANLVDLEPKLTNLTNIDPQVVNKAIFEALVPSLYNKCIQSSNCFCVKCRQNKLK